MAKYGIGQPVLRREDTRLLLGAGCFVDDLHPAGMTHAVLVRSPHAHALIRGIDTAAARAMPGVRLIATAADLAADGIGAIRSLTIPAPRPGTTPFQERRQPLLASDRARYPGEGVVLVVADTLAAARDAAEAVSIDWEPLPAATAADAASPAVWDDVPENICFDWEIGDRAAVDAAFAQAARVVALEETNNRVILNAIETRAALGEWIDDRYVLTTTTQMPNRMKTQLSEDILHVPADRIRVLVNDVGGGFGGKNTMYPEQGLVLWAVGKLRRPVKWVSERAEAFLTDTAGRDNITRGELALDAAGNFLAIRVDTDANLGAYNSNSSAVSPTNIAMIGGAYRLPAVYANVRGRFTHTVPVCAYRGAGRPEITYLLERLVDAAAFDLGVAPDALRRQNYIAEHEFPYPAASGLLYESAAFETLMNHALARVRWTDIDAQRKAAAARGRLFGIGISNYIERCGGGGGLSENARVSVAPDGTVTVAIGSQANGQGHVTAYSQVIAEWLGVPFERIEIVQGDTDRVATGLGTGGSWSIPLGGGAVARAADKVIAKARRIASGLLEAAAADIGFADGVFEVVGTDLRVSLGEVAAAASDPTRLPAGETPGLDEQDRFAPDGYTFPYGCHLCAVEIDADTGTVEITGYTAVHDFGRALNPMMLAGQVHGGVVQGIGQALMERTVYDGAGQLLTGSWMDYGLPRADDLPSFDFVPVETPTAHNPLGVKGCGEAGATGAPPAVINAILDALKPLGIRHIDMPAHPEAVWRAIQGARHA